MALQLITDLSRCPLLETVRPSLLNQVKFAYIFGADKNSAIFITDDDEVFGIGCNSGGCLGIDAAEDPHTPVRVDALCRKTVVAIEADTERHVMAATADGGLYVWGICSECPPELASPSLCRGLSGKATQVACGLLHWLVLTDKYQVMACGSNSHGQIGADEERALHKDKVRDLSPVRLPPGATAKAVDCCAFSSFAMTDKGELYAWGCSEGGELGIGDRNNQSAPVRTGGGKKIKDFACGQFHVVALDTDGRISAWGLNRFGQVKFDLGDFVSTPTEIKINESKFREVRAHRYCNFSAALAEDGETYVWGKIHSLQLKKPSQRSVPELFEAGLRHPVGIHMTLIPKNRNKMMACLSHHYNNKKLSDCTIVVDEKEIFAHEIILRMRSRYLRKMIAFSETQWMENRKLEIRNYSFSVISTYVEFLYTDQLLVRSDDDVCKLLELADEYDDEDFREKLIERSDKQTKRDSCFL